MAREAAKRGGEETTSKKNTKLFSVFFIKQNLTDDMIAIKNRGKQQSPYAK